MLTIEQVKAKLNEGKFLSLSADEAVLDKIPRGNWIGGTIPYFMDNDGGKESRDQVFVHEIPDFAIRSGIQIRFYDENDLPNVSINSPSNGFSLIIVPAFSNIHQEYAKKAPSYKDIYSKPLIGWISGIHLSDVGKSTPKVYNGLTGEKTDKKSVVMHVPLPNNKAANIDILNLFKQGNGDIITFEEDGFSAKNCLVNGNQVNLSDYLVKNNIDLKLPLVADLYGVMVNTSFQANDIDNKTVAFYAPVFRGIQYKIASPIENYVKQFISAIPGSAENNVFSCNCILNYLYSELNGKKTGQMVGPMTFGEIAYILLNQTLVYLNIIDI